jgi:hypothetical protein
MDGDELAVADQFADRDVQVRERRVKGADALEYVLRVSRDGVHGLRAVHDGAAAVLVCGGSRGVRQWSSRPSQ